MARLTFHGLLSCFRRQRQCEACCTPAGTREPPSAPSPPPSLPPSLPPSPPPSPLPSPPLPLLLRFPVDIVLYLCREHLPPAAAAALSLTCKALFGLVFPTAAPSLGRNPLERQALQLLLERDLGQHWWYCHGCSLLHRIRSQGPTVGVPSGSYGQLTWDSRRPHHNSHWLDGSSFMLHYENVRLVMNRHFLGPPNGLPLESFDVEACSTVFSPWQGRLLPWREKWSARILQDELFISATRTLSSAGWTDETFRAALDYEWRSVCGHVRTSSALPSHTVNALRHRSPGVSSGFFVPCRDVVESCCQCLADFATTVERRREDAEQTIESWFITVTSYHQLGSGRSPTDAKWEAFGQRMTVASYTMKRDRVAHPLGAVKAVWDSYRPQH